MRLWTVSTLILLLIGPAASRSHAGSFDPQTGQPGSLGIPIGSPLFVDWASSVVSFNPGSVDITNPNSALASFGNPQNILGPPTGDTAFNVVSLGDGGSITLGFNTPIANGVGADFAVFENGFLSGGVGMALLELAFVDVSSDGLNFFRFPSISETPTTTQVGGFGLVDASNLHNLAGKYTAGYGTGFDLEDLIGVSPLLDVNHIIQVRITDVVGSIDPAYGSYDSLGNLINDPFKTPFNSGGFDLNRVGVINQAATSAVPEPSSWLLGLTGIGIASLAARHRRAT
jgi:hypothetical protein